MQVLVVCVSHGTHSAMFPVKQNTHHVRTRHPPARCIVKHVQSSRYIHRHITKLDGSVGKNHDVTGLHVAMNHVSSVQVLERQEHTIHGI